MSKKITNTVYLHKKLFQFKILGIKTSPNRDYVVQKLLGIPKNILQSIHFNQSNNTKKQALNEKRVKIQQRRIASQEKENVLLDTSQRNIIDTDSLEALRDNYQSNIAYTHSTFNSIWRIDKALPENKACLHFSLENWQQLDPIRDNILADSIDDGYLSLIFLFPSKAEETEENAGHELKWDFFEGTFDEKNLHTDAYALIVALQLMNLGDINEKTCTDLVSNTFLNQSISTDEALQNNVAINNIAACDHTGGGTIIRATAGSSVEKYRKKLLGKKTVAGENQELESLKYGLSFLLTQTPGILCKLKIPIDTEAFQTTSGELSAKSSLWLFGPKYWIEFIEATTSNKDGSRDSKESRNIEDKDIYTINCEINPSKKYFDSIR